jgi:F-type H+-transporting ATPase subunit delta
MNESRISVRYSRAIFESALEKKILDDIDRDMKIILEVCRIPEFQEFLASPVILPSNKIKILHSIFVNNLNELSLSLLDLIVKNGREKFLAAVARVFIHETMEYKGITECLLTSAVKVDQKIIGQVTKLISEVFKTKVALRENIDESIIGGFILRVSDNYIDASVKNKLRKIKKGLSTGFENRIL